MKVPSNTIKDVRQYYKAQLQDYYPENEADVLLFMALEEYTGLSRTKVLIEPDNRISESQLLKIHFAVKDLKNYRPIQYILGKTEFYGCQILVNPDVLIPRPETEELVEWVVKEIKTEKKISILDIGTGSGAIAISIKKHCPLARVEAFDISPLALETAKLNAKNNKVDIDFYLNDVLNPEFKSENFKFDIIVSNPPYVRMSERKQMKPNVLDYEPGLALFVEDENPLLFYEAIAEYALIHLNVNGKVFCEINQYLGDETEKLFHQKGLSNVKIKKDINDNIRFVMAALK